MEVLCLSLFCYHYFVSILVLQLSGRETSYLLLLSNRCIVAVDGYVALPHGAMGWSAACGVEFPDHIHLLLDQTALARAV